MKLKCTVQVQQDQFAEGGFSYWVFSHEDMSELGYTAIQTFELDVDVPPRDVLVNGAIKAYRAEQSKIRAEAEKKAMRIEEAIQSLLCIENKG